MKRTVAVIHLEGCDIAALRVALRLVKFAKRENLLSPFGVLDPDAVAINLDRMAEDAANEMAGEPEPEVGYDYGLCECGEPANPSGHCDDCDDLEPEDEGMPGEPELCPECGTNSEPCRCKTIRRFPGPVPK